MREQIVSEESEVLRWCLSFKCQAICVSDTDSNISLNWSKKGSLLYYFFCLLAFKSKVLCVKYVYVIRVVYEDVMQEKLSWLWRRKNSAKVSPFSPFVSRNDHWIFCMSYKQMSFCRFRVMTIMVLSVCPSSLETFMTTEEGRTEMSAKATFSFLSNATFSLIHLSSPFSLWFLCMSRFLIHSWQSLTQNDYGFNSRDPDFDDRLQCWTPPPFNGVQYIVWENSMNLQYVLKVGTQTGNEIEEWRMSDCR